MTSLDLDLDAVLAGAADLARAAVLEIAPADQVGEHLGAVADAEPGVATHRFACTSTAYVGWHWSASVVRVPGSDTATVSEVVLLPGDGAILAPAWVPWQERVRPGDLAPGDLHPTSPEDPRLEPGYAGTDALEEVDDPASPYAVLRPEQWELGLGRERVLSVLGRDLAVERWYDGDTGPASAMAKAAPASCTSCGFLLPIGGLVGQAFGVCANPFGADGRVVSLEYGCGAHSSVREIEGTGIPVTEIVVDDYGFVEVHARQDVAEDEVVTSQVVIDEPDVADADVADVAHLDDAAGEDVADDVVEPASDTAASLEDEDDDEDQDDEGQDDDVRATPDYILDEVAAQIEAELATPEREDPAED